MKVTFFGGARTVTGSCYLLEIEQDKILVDCGMFQGSKDLEQLNAQKWPFNPGDISYVILTHAHIDHSGLLPKLNREGFKGKIICTKSTYDLCSVMLPDSGHIHQMEAEWQNRKRSRQRKAKVEPLYTEADAQAVLRHFVAISYDTITQLTPAIRFQMRDAGHILGSAIVEMWVTEEEKELKLVFSGDIGSSGQAIVKDPELIEEADYLFVESTYGNRLHPTAVEKSELLLDIIRQAVRENGLVIIPSFAVGRTQELLFQLHKLVKQGEISNIPVYVDSPLAIAATEIFQANPEVYDEETSRLFAQGDNPLAFPGLQFVRSAEESQRLNLHKGTAIVIAASGMADAGRILHHLKHQLWKENNHVVFVGYQAEGSLGRKLLSGIKRVKVLGIQVKVGAHIHDLSAFSAHADRDQLLAWLRGFTNKPKQTFIVHGEEDVALEFKQTIQEQLGLECYVPTRGEVIELHGESQGQLKRQTVEGLFELSDAELQAYIQALEHNIEGLGLALRKYRLQETQAMHLSEKLLKLGEQLDEMEEEL
ncbi:MBL fold metallo-hydrolase RNA specificity domain-containing protein [Brevibacillus ginsengisoli]|uniref:MBL fold metallo-hydrolase RNA specificity domain-containing protein n=1 Tax=Brevibacillus ginsengisoli TaxID=363854 RepID=UPI003CEE6096